MPNWIDDELATAQLPDQRLTDRYRRLLGRLADKPSLSIPAACHGLAETHAAYRFFDNGRFDADDLLAPHYDATVERIGQHPVVLIPQDTTLLDFTRPNEKLGGPLGDRRHWGFLAHVSLAVTPDRLALGVVANHVWARDEDTFGQAQQTDARYVPIEDKESRRWLDAYHQACAVAAAAPQTQVVAIADSEADIYELFVATLGDGPKADWIVRACQDRCLQKAPAATDEPAASTRRKLTAQVAAGPVLGTRTVAVQAQKAQSHDGRKRKQARSARTAQVTLQACSVVLQAPWRPGEKLPPVTVHVVLVREIDPPAGEAALEWLLLSSLPVATFEQAGVVVDYYGCRWEIEVFFRVLKSGCRVESSQLEQAERLQKCLALYLIVAWRVLYVLRLGRECPDLPACAVFTTAEWQAVYAVVHGEAAKAMPSVGEVVASLGRLGGHLGRKHDGPPGPKAIWIGLQRARDFATAWETFHAIHDPPPRCVER